MQSLLTCLLGERLPKMLPYVYQAAALIGIGHLLLSKDWLAVFGEYMRFWYCFLYLIVALASIITINVYLVTSRQLYTIAKIWSGAVAFPSFLISTYFIYQYSLLQSSALLLILQISLLVSAFVLGISTSILLNPEIARKLLRRTDKGVNQGN
jgi:hypothetical protein